jgi:ribosomal-protein-alanine N-acetyltransferase
MAGFRLDTERLYLRELAESDLDFIAQLWADPEVMCDYPETFSREHALKYIKWSIKKYSSDGVAPWLVIDRATEQPRGIAGIIMQTVHDETYPEIGYTFWKEHWRQGLATETARALRDYAFHVLDHPVVISLIPPANFPSFGVAKKIGMEPWKMSSHSNVEHIVFRVDKNGDTSWQNERVLAAR